MLILPPTARAQRAAVALRDQAVYREQSYLSGAALDAARRGADELIARRAVSGKLGSGMVDMRVRSCLTLDLLDNSVWPMVPEGLRTVLKAIDDMRNELAVATGRPLLQDAELQLLRYRPGGFYARHVDDRVGAADRPVRRSISLLIYLTPSDWDSAADGGHLRLHANSPARKLAPQVHDIETHERSETDGTSVVDVPPLAGSLILFDSVNQPHEVLPTKRERAALVGWLLEER